MINREKNLNPHKPYSKGKKKPKVGTIKLLKNMVSIFNRNKMERNVHPHNFYN